MAVEGGKACVLWIRGLRGGRVLEGGPAGLTLRPAHPCPVPPPAPHLADAAFRKTGLERTGPLRTDLAWFKSEYGMDAPVLVDDGPGRTYARLLTTLAATDPPAFICHFYNIYFAHTAGANSKD